MTKIKKIILEALLDYLKEKGYKNIRSKLSGMKDPEKISITGRDQEFIPDMVAIHNDSKLMFEVEIADEPNEEQLIDKCRVLSDEAAKTNGKLNLVVPLENYGKIIQILNNNKLENIGILQINMK